MIATIALTFAAALLLFLFGVFAYQSGRLLDEGETGPTLATMGLAVMFGFAGLMIYRAVF